MSTRRRATFDSSLAQNGADGAPILSGPLHKLGDFVKNWRSRFFTLHIKPIPILAYYRDEQKQRSPTQMLFLKGAKVEVSDVAGDRELWRFSVTDVDRTVYRLAATSEADRRRWLSALGQAIKSAETPSPSGSGFTTPPTPPPGHLMPGSIPEMEAVNDAKMGTELRKLPSQTSIIASSRSMPPDEFRRTTDAVFPAPPPSPAPGSLMKRLSLSTQCKEWAKETFLGSPTKSVEVPKAFQQPRPLEPVVQPLRSRAPRDILLDQGQQDLPQASLLEHFERAQQYVSRAQAVTIGEEAFRNLEGWRQMAAAYPNPTHQHLSAAAMFVLEVTRIDPHWAEWSETDVSAISPENMLEQLRKRPSLKVLEDLGLCLAYRSTTWLSVYCRLGGVGMQLEALKVHMDAARAGNPDAPGAVEAALHSLFTLKSAPAGVQALLNEEGSLERLCQVLFTSHVEACKLVLDMLLHILIFSEKGYFVVIKTMVGERVNSLLESPPLSPTPATPSVPAAANPNSTAELPASPFGSNAVQTDSGGSSSSGPTSQSKQGKAPPPPPPPPLPAKKAVRAGAPPPAAPPPPPMRAPRAGPPPPAAPPPPPIKAPRAGPPPPAAPPPPPIKAPKAGPPPPAAPPPPPVKVHPKRAAPAAPPPPPKVSRAGAAPAAPPPPAPPPPCKAGGGAPPAPPPPPGKPGKLAAKPAGKAGASLADALRSRGAGSSLPAEEQSPSNAPAATPSPSTAAAAPQAVARPIQPPAAPGPTPQRPPPLVEVPAAAPEGRAGSEGAQGAGASIDQSMATSRRNRESDIIDSSRQEFCTPLLGLLKGDTDMELATKVLTLILAAMNAADADLHCALRLRFVKMLLAKGLLGAVAEANSQQVEHMTILADCILARFREVMAKAQREVAKTPPPKPPPPAPRPAPPPPPPRAPPRGMPTPPAPPGAPLANPGPKPRLKMKSLFWEKLPDIRIPGTFWSTHPPKYELLHQQQAEDLFQAKQPAASVKSNKVQKKRKMNVIDVQRATAIGVQAKGLKCHWTEVEAAIASFDPHVFSCMEDVVTVMKCLPTEDEQGLLQSFVGSGASPDLLTDEEKFCILLMKIPRVHSRLNTFKVKFEAQLLLVEVATALHHHLHAQAELKASTCFAAVLEEALAHGNFFNHSTRLGQAAGFRLTTLGKLQDMRSVDGSTTLMNYIAANLAAREQPPPPLLSELPHVVLLVTTLAETREINEKVAASITAVERELKMLPPPVTVALEVHGDDRVSLRLTMDNYHLSMLHVAQEFAQELAKVQELQKKAEAGFSALVAYFGENPNSIPSDSTFWQPIAKFAQIFTATQNELLKKKKEQEERARRRAKAAPSRGTSTTPGGQQAEGGALPKHRRPRMKEQGASLNPERAHSLAEDAGKPPLSKPLPKGVGGSDAKLPDQVLQGRAVLQEQGQAPDPS